MNTKQVSIEETNTQKEPGGNGVKKKRNRTKKTSYRYDPLAKYGSWVTAGSLMLPDMN
jgi:hypothetical protein